MNYTLTKEMKLGEVHDTIRRARSGDTLFVPADEVALVKRALRSVCPEKKLTIKAQPDAAAKGDQP